MSLMMNCSMSMMPKPRQLKDSLMRLRRSLEPPNLSGMVRRSSRKPEIFKIRRNKLLRSSMRELKRESKTWRHQRRHGTIRRRNSLKTRPQEIKLKQFLTMMMPMMQLSNKLRENSIN